MVARGPGAVGCAHCTLVGADQSCQICTRLVCASCAADWTTCSEPSGRVIRLGTTARLRDVDPTGRLGLVSHWRRPLRIFDLRQLRWVRDVHVPRAAFLFNRRNPPRLTSDARVIYADWDVATGESGSYTFNGFRRLDLRDSHSALIASEQLERCAALTAARDMFYYVSATEHVIVLDGRQLFSFDPLPRKVLQAVHLDGEHALLATASWSEVALDRIVDGKLHRLSRRTTKATGDAVWVATAGRWLVIAIQIFGRATSIEVRRLGRDDRVEDVVYLHATSELRSASLSRDGRYLAFTGTEGLVVQSLDTGEETVFTDHTDDINLVRFVGDDHLLVSADTDNRVVMRPRTPTGYARPLIAIDVPQEGVELVR